MRIHLPGQDITFDSAADLSTHQYKFAVGAAKSGTSQEARVNVSGINARMFGILQNKANAANQGAVVRVSGMSKLVVDGSGTPIAVGSLLKADSTGRGVVAAVDKDHVGAYALEASVAANDIIAVMVMNLDIAV